MTAVVLVLFLAQVLAALGLARTLHRSTLGWSVTPAVAASLGADLTMSFVTDDSFVPLAGALSLGLVAVLLGQVVRADRTEVVDAMVAGCGCLLATVPAAVIVGLDGLPQGSRPVLAIAAAAVIGALPLPLPPSLPPSLPLSLPLQVDAARAVVGTLAAALICSHSGRVEPFDGVLIGLAAVVAALLTRHALTAPYAKVALLAPVLVGISAGAIVGRGILG